MDEIKEETKKLKPDKVGFDEDGRIKGLNEKFKNKNVIYIWWD